MSLTPIAEQGVMHLLGFGNHSEHSLFCSDPVIKIGKTVNSGKQAVSSSISHISKMFPEIDDISISPDHTSPCRSVITSEGNGMVMGSFMMTMQRKDRKLPCSVDVTALISNSHIHMIHCIARGGAGRTYPVYSGKTLFCLKDEHVKYILSAKDYSIWHTIKHPDYPSCNYLSEKASLSSHESTLSGAFIKVGRKYYVNMLHVRSTYIEEAAGEHYLVMSDDHHIKIPNENYRKICKVIDAWKRTEERKWIGLRDGQVA